MLDPSKLPELDIEALVYQVNCPFQGTKILLGKVRIAASSCLSFPNVNVIYYRLENPSEFWIARGSLGLKVYTAHDHSIISNPFPPVDAARCSALSILESILHDESSRPCSIQLEHLKEITNNFSDDRILGQGGSGVVYKVRSPHILPCRSTLFSLV